MHKYLFFLVFMLSGLNAASDEGLRSPTSSFGPSGTDSKASSVNEIPMEASKIQENNYYPVATFLMSGVQRARPLMCDVFLCDKKVRCFRIFGGSLEADGSVIATLKKIKPGKWFGTCDADMRVDVHGYGRKKIVGFRVLEMVNATGKLAPIMDLSGLIAV